MSIKTASDLVQTAIEEFVSGLPNIQKKQFDRVMGTLKELTLDADGLIKPNIQNMKVMDKVRLQLEAVVQNPTYLGNVASLQGTITKIADAKTGYFSAQFAEFNKPPVMAKIESNAFKSAAVNLTESGINANVVGESISVLEQAVTSGSSFVDMVNNLEVQMLGNAEIDSRLVSYSKQIMTDTLSGFTRDYNNLVVKDLGLEWYRYVGSLVKTSRPFCEALVAKEWIHESELGAIAGGNIDGKKVSKAGMMPDTNATNVLSRCGGFNCNHEMIPVSEESVPEKLRVKFSDKSDPDGAEEDTE